MRAWQSWQSSRGTGYGCYRDGVIVAYCRSLEHALFWEDHHRPIPGDAQGEADHAAAMEFLRSEGRYGDATAAYSAPLESAEEANDRVKDEAARSVYGFVAPYPCECQACLAQRK